MSSASIAQRIQERHVGIVDFDVDRLPVDTERRLHRRLTRQIVPLPSSVTNSEPSFATATPTGRPQTCVSETTTPSWTLSLRSGRRPACRGSSCPPMKYQGQP